jgi:hypothetical protein
VYCGKTKTAKERHSNKITTDLSSSAMISSKGNRSMLLKLALLGSLAPASAFDYGENESNSLLRKRIEQEGSVVGGQKKAAGTSPIMDNSIVGAFEDIWDHASVEAKLGLETERLLQGYNQMSMSMPTKSPTPGGPTATPTRPPTVSPTATPRPTKSPSAGPTPSPSRTPSPTVPTSAPTASPTVRETLAPTPAPTTKAPTISPAPTPVPTELCFDETKEEYLLSILSLITDEDTLLDKTTPQGMAFDYLLNDDIYLKNPCGKPTIAQRYGLTTLYFATSGESWTASEGWLGENQECDWYGVKCDANLRATDLELGKSNARSLQPLIYIPWRNISQPLLSLCNSH